MSRRRSTYGAAVALTDFDRTLLAFLEDRYAANFSELSQRVGSSGLSEKLERLTGAGLLAIAPETAQYHAPDTSNTGENRWLLTDQGRRALAAE